MESKVEKELKIKQAQAAYSNPINSDSLVGQIRIACDFVNNRPQTFRDKMGVATKLVCDYAEELEAKNKQLSLTLDDFCQDCDRLIEENNTLNNVNNQLHENYTQQQKQTLDLLELLEEITSVCNDSINNKFNTAKALNTVRYVRELIKQHTLEMLQQKIRE